ncbi:MAG TPA: hypothetical protein VFO01_15465, partial [Trebonia sp.]|nr:hypothetical protein [Trebonia sp.]
MASSSVLSTTITGCPHSAASAVAGRPVQRALVEAGWLGRKTGRGWYQYGEDAPPAVADAAPACPAPAYVIEHGQDRGRSPALAPGQRAERV